MLKIVKSLEQLIGNTPLMELKKIKEKYNLYANIFAKLEFFNIAGSVKDRVALSMVNDAVENGLLKPGGTVIEATSGNTGIGLAAVCKDKGYNCKIVMPDSMSQERIKIIKSYGADVVLTDGKYGMKGAIEKAEELNLKTENSIIAGQFFNPSNPNAHYQTTGPEIFNDLDGNIDIFVCGVGSGGTISGVGKFLKEKNSSVKIVAVEPEKSPVISKGEGGKHGIQGIGAGFIPQNLDISIIDEVILVGDQEAFDFARKVCEIQGIAVGISSGAALVGALNLALRPENKDKNIAVLFPDGASRYLSTELFK